jgi:hypothetical protein
MSRPSISELVSAYVHFYPGDEAAQLVDLLNGAHGMAPAREALTALTDGFPDKVWTLGRSGHTLTNVRSTAAVLIDGGRLAVLRDLVSAGAPACLGEELTPQELQSKSAWLARLCRSRIPAHERHDSGQEFSATSLFRLATCPVRPDSQDILELAFAYDPAHPDIEKLQRTLPPAGAAALTTAVMRHRIRSVETPATPALKRHRSARAV